MSDSTTAKPSPAKPSPRQVAAVMLALSILAVVVLALAAEVAAALLAPPEKAAYIAGRRAADPAVYPAVTPQIVLTETGFKGFDASGGASALVPLGGVARARTVFCREDGDYLEYVSDRYGFHNPDEAWDAPAADVALVGDSFVQGACVPAAHNFASVLRREHAAVLNLGSFGNGPLANLGTIREYLPAKRPRTVLWFYVSNDLGVDLGIERGSPVLRQYLRPGFSQNLADRQPEIDAALKPFLAASLDRELKREAASAGERFLDFVTLHDLRRAIKLALERRRRPPPPTVPQTADYDRFRMLDMRLFDESLTAARDLVRSWGGELRLVIIPDARMFGGYAPTAPGLPPDAFVAQLSHRVRALDVPVIDLHAVVGAHPRPMELYAPMGGFYGHFNADGYELAGAAVAEALRAARH